MSDDFEDLYGSKYLAASDIKKPFTAIIETVDKLDFARQGERQKMKVVLTLKGQHKPVVVNKTNALTLSEAFGTDFDDWPDKRITVKAEPTTFNGKRVMGLRMYPANAGDTPPLPKKSRVDRHRLFLAARRHEINL
jgi:hypothetical protein